MKFNSEEQMFLDRILGKSGARIRKDEDDRVLPVLPRSFAVAMMPELFSMGKALPLTVDQVSPARLIQGQIQDSLFHYPIQAPGEVASLFPLTTHAPARGGSAKWPQLDQAENGAVGAPDELAEYGCVSVGWEADGAEIPGSDFKLKSLDIPAGIVSAYTEFSRTLAQRSAVDFLKLLQTVFRAAILHKLDYEILNGNGVKKPKGILQTAGVSEVARAVANQVSYLDLANLEDSMPVALRGEAVWVLSKTAHKYLRKQRAGADNTGDPLYPTLGGKTPTLFNYPVITTSRTPALGTRGDVLFGAFSQYVCAVEEEIGMDVSDQAKLREGVVCAMSRMGVGGKVANLSAFVALDDAA